jgi:hypothetical protein
MKVIWPINEENCSVKQIGTFATGSNHYNIDEIINMQTLRPLK